MASLQRERAPVRADRGATRATYKPTAADAGHTLVAVVAASAGGTTQSALTAATAPIT